MSDYAYLKTEDLHALRERLRDKLAYDAKRASPLSEAEMPYSLKHEIDTSKAKIDAINAELAKRGITSADPPPNTERAQVIHYYIQGDYNDQRGAVTIHGGDFANATITGYVEQLQQGPAQQQRLVKVREELATMSGEAQAAGDHDREDVLDALKKALERAQSDPAQLKRADAKLAELPDADRTRILALLAGS